MQLQQPPPTRRDAESKRRSPQHEQQRGGEGGRCCSVAGRHAPSLLALARSIPRQPSGPSKHVAQWRGVGHAGGGEHQWRGVAYARITAATDRPPARRAAPGSARGKGPERPTDLARAKTKGRPKWATGEVEQSEEDREPQQNPLRRRAALLLPLPSLIKSTPAPQRPPPRPLASSRGRELGRAERCRRPSALLREFIEPALLGRQPRVAFPRASMTRLYS